MAEILIRKFGVDVLYVADTSAPELSRFSERHAFLSWPYLRQDLFQTGHAGLEPAVADVLPIIEALGREPEGILAQHLSAEEHAAALFEISEDDHLCYVLLANFGAYPSLKLTGTNYVEAIQEHLGAEMVPQKFPFAGHLGDMWTPTRLSRYGLTENSRLQAMGGDGIFVGGADNFDDLVTFWNVRALGADVQFYDPREERLRATAAAQVDRIRRTLSGRKASEPIGVWHLPSSPALTDAIQLVGATAYPCVADEQWWSQLPVFTPPSTDKSYVLPTVTTAGRAELTFQLPPLPFPEDSRGHMPLVAISIDPTGDFSETSDLTIWTPYIPQLNPFYSGMHTGRYSIRSEPDGFAVLIHQGIQILTLHPLQRSKLLEEVFSAFGITAEESDAGRVTTRLIRQMGSILACAVFKLRGVRRLIARYSPLQSFTRGTATKLIHEQSGTAEGESLANLTDVHLGNRRLTANAAFDFLLSRGVFRVGLDLGCPHCTLTFWVAVDDLRSVATCEYCGESFSIAMQLKDRDWRYRRSGLFGKEDSQSGGIPVALAIHQLTEGIHFLGKSAFRPGILFSSPHGLNCESDFVLLVQQSATPRRLEIVVGECKAEGGTITRQDVQNMVAIADIFPLDQISAFIVFAKTGDFSEEEIEICRMAQTNPPRVILLSRRELEPTFVYTRAAKEFEIKEIVISFAGLARNTADIFFQPKTRTPQGS